MVKLFNMRIKRFLVKLKLSSIQGGPHLSRQININSKLHLIFIFWPTFYNVDLGIECFEISKTKYISLNILFFKIIFCIPPTKKI